MTCKFCEAMKVNRQCDKIDKSPNELTYGKYMSEYTVAIVAHHWYSKMGKRTAGRTVDYRHMGLGYKLNYWSVAGRWRGSSEQLNREKRQYPELRLLPYGQ